MSLVDAALQRVTDYVSTQTGGDTFFVKQPKTPDEVERACRAIDVCCANALRYAGDDPAIIRRLQKFRPSAACCDALDERSRRTGAMFVRVLLALACCAGVTYALIGNPLDPFDNRRFSRRSNCAGRKLLPRHKRSGLLGLCGGSPHIQWSNRFDIRHWRGGYR